MQRLQELAAKIAIEKDHDRFTVLVKGFKQLLDDEKQQPEEPPQASPSVMGKSPFG